MQFVDRTIAVATIDELRAVLQTSDRPWTAPELVTFTSRLRIPRKQWRGCVAFNAHRFCYQTLYASPQFEVNLIGWRSGQHSSVHDHRGTACCVLVLDGILTNRDYSMGSGSTLNETGRFDLKPGEILSRTGWEIHRCGNEQTHGVDLVTLHLYSPPLRPLSERQYHG